MLPTEVCSFQGADAKSTATPSLQSSSPIWQLRQAPGVTMPKLFLSVRFSDAQPLSAQGSFIHLKWCSLGCDSSSKTLSIWRIGSFLPAAFAGKSLPVLQGRCCVKAASRQCWESWINQSTARYPAWNYPHSTRVPGAEVLFQSQTFTIALIVAGCDLPSLSAAQITLLRPIQSSIRANRAELSLVSLPPSTDAQS